MKKLFSAIVIAFVCISTVFAQNGINRVSSTNASTHVVNNYLYNPQPHEIIEYRVANAQYPVLEFMCVVGDALKGLWYASKELLLALSLVLLIVFLIKVIRKGSLFHKG